MIIKISHARSSRTLRSTVQYSKRAHVVRVQNHSTPDAAHVVVSPEVYANALSEFHGDRFWV